MLYMHSAITSNNNSCNIYNTTGVKFHPKRGQVHENPSLPSLTHPIPLTGVWGYHPGEILDFTDALRRVLVHFGYKK